MRPNLERLRTIQTAALDQRGRLERVTRVVDSTGGHEETWALVATVACSLGAPRNEVERLVAQKVSNGAGWMLTLPWGTDAREGDRFVIGARAYPIVYVEDAVSFATALRCVVEVVE